jgi:hypothetical protein
MNGGSWLLAAMQCTMMSSDATGKLTGDLVYVPSYSKLDEVKRKRKSRWRGFSQDKSRG